MFNGFEQVAADNLSDSLPKQARLAEGEGKNR